MEKEENTLNLNKFPPPRRSYSVLIHIVFEIPKVTIAPGMGMAATTGTPKY